ncbi:hypothetical protein H8356DRAFT_1621728 [Neocallimastix lanati (nom. inval.)]|nr:hypothetical protein H8356DRAFT_1621728 [Neocallimastix sp. JGI-2020a]
MNEESSRLLNNNINEALTKNENSEISLIKPVYSTSQSILYEATLTNSSEIELNENINSSCNINKNNETVISSKNSTTHLSNLKKKDTSKEVFSIEENKKCDQLYKSKASSKKVLSSTHKLSKLAKSTSAQLNNSMSTSSLASKSVLSSKQKSKITTTSPTSQKNIRNSSNNSFSSNINNKNHNNTTTTLTKKIIINHSSSKDNNINKKNSYKEINPIKTSLLSNKPLMSQSSKKLLKSDSKKSISNQNELSNYLDRKRSLDNIQNGNDSQQKFKKLTNEKKEIYEREIVLKSNEYRKAIAKINSLEKTIKQLQAQHSETLSSLHSEIARLQRACSEKALVKAFEGTGLLTSLSNNLHNLSYIEKSNNLESSMDSLNDQDIVLNTINKIPKGMNLLPKISAIKKEIGESKVKDEGHNKNIINKTITDTNKKSDVDSNNNDSNKTSEIKSNNDNKEEKTINMNLSNIKKIKSSNSDINEKLTVSKKKTSGSIRVHKYHTIEKLNIIKSPNNTLEPNYSTSTLSDSNLSMDTTSSSYVTLSDASTAVALSSGHSSSISSLIKSNISLNEHLQSPLPPNYSKNSGKSSESPRHLINLPKIIQPIVKMKENKNTSINLPSLINNKSTKNSQRY